MLVSYVYNSGTFVASSNASLAANPSSAEVDRGLGRAF
jgi:hypothetical protein